MSCGSRPISPFDGFLIISDNATAANKIGTKEPGSQVANGVERVTAARWSRIREGPNLVGTHNEAFKGPTQITKALSSDWVSQWVCCPNCGRKYFSFPV